MRPSRFAIAALVVSTLGCLEGLDTPDGKAGFITIEVLDAGGDAYAVQPFGVFYDESNLRFNRPVAGQCAVLPFFNDDAQFSSGKTMNVGASVTTSLPTGTDELLPTEEFGFTFYRTTNPGGIPLTPGDTMTFTISGGGGFPATSIADATPETFTFATVGVPAEAMPIPVTWTAPQTTTGSLINFSLRFADDFSEGPVNRHISCYFADDGEAEIPRNFVDGWIRAKDGVRSVSVTRLRSKVVQVSDDIAVTMISTLSVPTDLLTP